MSLEVLLDTIILIYPALFLGITDWMLLPSLRSLIGAQSDIEASSPKDFSFRMIISIFGHQY